MICTRNVSRYFCTVSAKFRLGASIRSFWHGYAETAVKKTGDAHDVAFGEQIKNWRACGGPATLLTRGSRMGVQQNAGRAGRIVAGAGTPDLPPSRSSSEPPPFSNRGPRGCLRCKAGPKGRGAIDGWRMRRRTGVFDNLATCKPVAYFSRGHPAYGPLAD